MHRPGRVKHRTIPRAELSRERIRSSEEASRHAPAAIEMAGSRGTIRRCIVGRAIQAGELGRDRRKGPAVVDGRPEPGQRREMLRHAIAHVALEAVAGMGSAEPHHQPVAGDLGDDRGGGDREHQRVAATSPPRSRSRSRSVAAVDEDELRPHRQRLDRARQRPERGAQDVVAVDARGRAEGDRHLARVAQIFS